MALRPSPSTRFRWRRRLRSLAALLFLAAMALTLWHAQPTPTDTLPLVQVIDGDSIAVTHQSGRRVIRLAGLDAVEYRQECMRADGSRWTCGQEARAALIRLAGHGPLYCALAAQDKYRRTLATCRTRPEPDGVDLSAEMIRLGWAVANGDAYLSEEGEAELTRRGIWQGAFELPADWRAAHERSASLAGGTNTDH